VNDARSHGCPRRTGQHTLLHMDWRVPRRPSKFRKAVLSDVRALYSLSRKMTIKGGLALRLQATLLFSQEVNSRFEATVEGTGCTIERHLYEPSAHPWHLAAANPSLPIVMN
jgi:hypothetical protein